LTRSAGPNKLGASWSVEGFTATEDYRLDGGNHAAPDKAPLMSSTQIVGRSAWTQALRQRISQLAPFSSSVLITGPSGTGKELIARAIHDHSPRAAQPFVPVDCASLTGELFASHLFGHVKGAFTGADYPRLGCFRAAEGGTILLDEIGEISLDLQAKLLRTIQERTVVPLGSEKPVPINVRVIAATNRNLAEEVERGRFRLDLFYRLNVISLETLALRDRLDEIEPLALHFLERFALEQGLPHKRLSPAAVRALQGHGWPGNVRELQNVLERAAVFASGDVIDANAFAFPEKARSPLASLEVPPGHSAAPAATDEPSWYTLDNVEEQHIRRTLEHTYFNQSAAARLLNIDRASLTRKIQRYGIRMPASKRGRPASTVARLPVDENISHALRSTD
jgi:DNA-binding NtrC family response regulator